MVNPPTSTDSLRRDSHLTLVARRCTQKDECLGPERVGEMIYGLKKVISELEAAGLKLGVMRGQDVARSDCARVSVHAVCRMPSELEPGQLVTVAQLGNHTVDVKPLKRGKRLYKLRTTPRSAPGKPYKDVVKALFDDVRAAVVRAKGVCEASAAVATPEAVHPGPSPPEPPCPVPDMSRWLATQADRPDTPVHCVVRLQGTQDTSTVEATLSEALGSTPMRPRVVTHDDDVHPSPATDSVCVVHRLPCNTPVAVSVSFRCSVVLADRQLNVWADKLSHTVSKIALGLGVTPAKAVSVYLHTPRLVAKEPEDFPHILRSEGLPDHVLGTATRVGSPVWDTGASTTEVKVRTASLQDVVHGALVLQRRELNLAHLCTEGFYGGPHTPACIVTDIENAAELREQCAKFLGVPVDALPPDDVVESAAHAVKVFLTGYNTVGDPGGHGSKPRRVVVHVSGNSHCRAQDRLASCERRTAWVYAPPASQQHPELLDVVPPLFPSLVDQLELDRVTQCQQCAASFSHSFAKYCLRAPMNRVPVLDEEAAPAMSEGHGGMASGGEGVGEAKDPGTPAPVPEGQEMREPPQRAWCPHTWWELQEHLARSAVHRKVWVSWWGMRRDEREERVLAVAHQELRRLWMTVQSAEDTPMVGVDLGE